MVAFRRVMGLGFALLVGFYLWASIGVIQASAHAELVSSNPVDGSTVQGPVTDLLLNFGEGVKHISSMKVQDDQGKTYKVDSYSYNGKQVMVHLADPLNIGTFSLSWTALSEDGHEAPGAFTFSVEGKGMDPSSSTKRPTTKTAASNHSNHLVTVLLGVLLVLIIVGFVVMLKRPNKK